MSDIVLDTNCLIASFSKKGNYFEVWKGLQEGRYTLCVSNEILAEYEEIISHKVNRVIAANVIQMLLSSPFVRLIVPYYHFQLIKADVDDNKFVDCAIAANASCIVSEDSHFNVLKSIPFPKVEVIHLEQFMQLLSNEK